MPKQKQLAFFEEETTLPEGLIYRADFISPEEEERLLEGIKGLEFHEFEMHGVIAKRRTAHFGWNYQYESWKVTPGEPIPDFLRRLRDRLSELVDVPVEEWGEVLVTEYPAGAGIGWHRDARAFGIVAGISLLGACRMRFRLSPEKNKSGKRNTSIALPLPPRSAYILKGPARSLWQHSIPAVAEPRYSITFRTLRLRG